MIMKRRANAVWQGSGLEGKGKLNTTSGTLKDVPYSTAMRFVDEEGRSGTNPEELIAAAHSGCYAMALSFGLTGAGFVPEELKVQATVSIEKMTDHWEITGVVLDLKGKVPGISKEQFVELANAAKAGCPVSRALKAVPITLVATLV